MGVSFDFCCASMALIRFQIPSDYHRSSASRSRCCGSLPSNVHADLLHPLSPAGPGPGRDGGRGRAGMGWGTCVFLHKNVRRNRLECRFGAEYRGKNPVLFTGFFPRGTGYFPRFPGFFPREKSGEFEGKIWCYHLAYRRYCQGSEGTMSSRDCRRSVRTRTPPPTAGQGG